MSWLPQDSGWLPTWLLFVSVLSFFNTFQAYLQPLTLTRRLYNNTPHEVTAMTSRMFACWTLVSAVVRLYGAYHLRNPVVYSMLFWTYSIAYFHYFTEIFIYRSAKLTGPAISPVIVASCSLIWMWTSSEYYIGSSLFF